MSSNYFTLEAAKETARTAADAQVQVANTIAIVIVIAGIAIAIGLYFAKKQPPQQK